MEVDVPSVCGTTPFCIACAFENYREAELLLSYGANINYKDKDGRTPLFYAKVRKNSEMIKFLHDNNAANNVVDNYGISILDLDDEKIREKLFKELY